MPRCQGPCRPRSRRRAPRAQEELKVWPRRHPAPQEVVVQWACPRFGHHVCTSYNPAHPAPDGPLTDSAARYRSRIRVQHAYSGCNPKSNTVSGDHRPRRHQGRVTSIIGIVDPTGATEDSRENMERPVCGNVGAIARGIGGRSRSKMQ